jgi:hypothetical protein
MVNVLDIALGVLIVASLVAIVAYAVIFLAVTAWTALRSPRRDPLTEEFDAFLAELWALGSDHLVPSTRRATKPS